MEASTKKSPFDAKFSPLQCADVQVFFDQTTYDLAIVCHKHTRHEMCCHGDASGSTVYELTRFSVAQDVNNGRKVQRGAGEKDGWKVQRS